MEPVKICLLVSMAILMSLPIVRADTTFTKESPLLWTETPEQWESGSYKLTLSLHLETPCRQFVKDIDWCEREFNEILFHPLQDLCMKDPIPSETTVHRREKRWLKKVLEFAGTVILGVTSKLINSDIGGSAPAFDEHKHKVSELEHEVRVMDERILSVSQEVNNSKAKVADLRLRRSKLLETTYTFEAFNNLNRDIRLLERQTTENEQNLQNFMHKKSEHLEKLNVAMADLNKDLVDLHEWRKGMDASLSDKIKAISDFVSYFSKLETTVRDFSRNWRRGLLSDDLFDILMISHNESIVSEYSGARPRSCRFSKVTQLAVFNFEKKTINAGITILEAKPFRLHRPIPGTEMVEVLNYQGPRNILYLSSSQCAVPFDKDNGLTYTPSAADCHTFEREHTFQKFWTKSCETDATLYGNEVQIQQMADRFFIYCNGQDINIYGHSQPCPNYVFSIPAGERYRITKFGTGALLKDQNYGPRNDVLSLKVNHRIFPNMLQIDFDNIPIGSDACPSNTIEYFALGTSAAIVLAILGIGAYIRRRQRKAQKDVKQFLSKLKFGNGEGINTLVRVEVAKQLSTEPKNEHNPPSYESYEPIMRGKVTADKCNGKMLPGYVYGKIDV